MKTLTALAIILFSTTSFAYNPNYSDLVSYENETDTEQFVESLNSEQVTIEGLWVLSTRRCLSGAPVLDGYNPARDYTEIRYNNGTFDYYSRVNSCSYSSRGNYELSGPLIVYKKIRSRSNCGPTTFRTRDQNTYRLNNNHLALFFGPFVQGPAPCPMGDMLEVNYLRLP